MDERNVSTLPSIDHESRLPDTCLLPTITGSDPLQSLWGTLPDGSDRELVKLLRQDPEAMRLIDRE